MSTSTASTRALIGEIGYALWMASAGIAPADEGWARGAWDDMGGSEPAEERAKWEITAVSMLPIVRAQRTEAARAALDGLPAGLEIRRRQCEAKDTGGGQCRKPHDHEPPHRALGLAEFDPHFSIQEHRDAEYPAPPANED